MDILDPLPSIKIATGYKLGGDFITSPPDDVTLLAKCEPVYEEVPGWQSPTRGITELNKLPNAARAYLDRISELAEIPITIVSTGPDRDETIMC